MSLEERVYKKIQKTDYCWIWTGNISKTTGYGVIGGSGGMPVTGAHRAMIKLVGREIPHGMVVDHICRVRRCVNPNHLRIVTRAINNIENSTSPPALNRIKTHCYKGHEFSSENIWVETRKDGRKQRRCKKCRSAATLLYKKKLKLTRITSGIR